MFESPRNAGKRKANYPMDKIVLYPPRKRTILLLCGALAFVGSGLLLIHSGRTLGWVPVCCFGIFAVPLSASMWRRSSYLLIEDNGFTFVTLFRATEIPWHEVGRFYVKKLIFRPTVFFDWHPISGNDSRARSNKIGCLPNSYGMTAEGLATLLNTWRERDHPARPI